MWPCWQRTMMSSNFLCHMTCPNQLELGQRNLRSSEKAHRWINYRRSSLRRSVDLENKKDHILKYMYVDLLTFLKMFILFRPKTVFLQFGWSLICCSAITEHHAFNRFRHHYWHDLWISSRTFSLQKENHADVSTYKWAPVIITGLVS